MGGEQVGGETNLRHLENPEPGDFWNEMMSPALVVLSRTQEGGVVVITDTVDKDHGWMWDFNKARIISLDQLREHVRYCFCYPRFHANAVTWWKEHLGIGGPA